MNKLYSIFFFLLLSIPLSAQNALQDLKKELATTTSARDKADLNYEIGQLLLKQRSYKEAGTYLQEAYDVARGAKIRSVEAQSTYALYEVNVGLKKESNQNYWLDRAIKIGKEIGDSDLIIKATYARSRNWTRQGKYRQAYLINQDAFEYFSAKGTSISELERKYAREQQRLTQERNNLQQQKAQLSAERDTLASEINSLQREKAQLSSANENLQEQTQILTQENKEVQQQVTETTEALQTVSEEKQVAEQNAAQRAAEVKELSRDTLEKQLIIQESRNLLIESELELEKRNKFLFGLGIGLLSLLLISLSLYSRFRTKKRAARQLSEKNTVITIERQRSDRLLRNILPDEIAEELKATGKAQARKYEEVTVFFSDFKNFTTTAARLDAEELVSELDTIFRKFDEIIEKYPDIEKIKTIGDAYMCATGFSKRKSLPNNIVKASLEMQAYLNERKREGLPFAEARIGLHTGEVVAGVVGSKKFAYDIWGDTVNTASRMESNGEVGKVNVSGDTYQHIKYGFKCAHRGKIQAKNKGLIDMYFVEETMG